MDTGANPEEELFRFRFGFARLVASPMDLAILTFKFREEYSVYWAQGAKNSHPLQSAPVALIQGIYEQRPEMARKILRERIFTTAPMSEALRETVKVCAKRIDAGISELEIPSGAIELTLPSSPLAPPRPPSIPSMEQARWLAQSVARENKPLYLRDRAIGAVLVSRDGELLAHSVNTNAINRFCHAEINLLRQLQSGGVRRIPAGASLYVTLKPCRMCAAMILAYSEDPSTIHVYFDEDDPGTNARRTALDLFSQPIQKQLLDPLSVF